ncbi:hypothetical protein NQ315_016087 [Exocentrus adspersus]|uniref:CCHC-type domain-containing protein n=1 Tax=Exocentrus adspersus TaxID=1586481 RepID=A0AAV8VL40_9CUCU|nr:hypothetical protein NQ315_016087 [Exocentrus adspersus]
MSSCWSSSMENTHKKLLNAPYTQENEKTTQKNVVTMPESETPQVPASSQGNIVFTNEQFEAFLSRLTIGNRSDPVVQTQTPTDNFSKCSTRFNGSKDSDVNAFIDAILVYKDCALVNDENALKGLPMLLDGFAAKWYQGVKATITSWNEAIDLLRTAFGPRKPPYRVYRDLFATEQDSNTPCDVFVCKARAILADLPADTLKEETQIDMVYGLLHCRIREKVPRDSVSTFTELLKKCRHIEETSFPRDNTSSMEQKANKRPRCHYCKYVGHTKDKCRKLLGKSETKVKCEASVQDNTRNVNVSHAKSATATSTGQYDSRPSTSKVNAEDIKPITSVKCYGCGKPGYVRSKCPVCNAHSGTESSSIEFLSLETLVEPRARPLLQVEILGHRGVGLIDTAAKQSVAGHSLYEILKTEKQQFTQAEIFIKLADGSGKMEKVLVTEQDVFLEGRKVVTKFIVFPDATNNRTLFGIDFLQDANMVLNLAQSNWNFKDQQNVVIPLKYENSVTSPSLVDLSSLENLRSDEGTMLTESQREELNAVLRSSEDIFQPGGEPTPDEGLKDLANSILNVAESIDNLAMAFANKDM